MGGWLGAYLAQLLRVLVQLLQEGKGLVLGAVLQDPLDHPAAIRVGGQHKHLGTGNTQQSHHHILPSHTGYSSVFLVVGMKIGSANKFS